MPVFIAMAGIVKQEDMSRPAWSKSETRPYLHNNQSKKAGGMAQVVRCLTIKCKVLN
jgi:hypothetical protein